MKAHDLARALLAGPDVEVVAGFDDAPEYVCDVELGEPTTGYPENDRTAPKVEVRPLWYGSGSVNYDLTE